MPRHLDPVTVALPIGADLLRRLDAVAADLHLDRPDAIHAVAASSVLFGVAVSLSKILLQVFVPL